MFQFVRFANIEEDTPSYHRRYDFFVSKFSSMCHSNHNDINMRDGIRLAGIRGIQVSEQNMPFSYCFYLYKTIDSIHCQYLKIITVTLME